VVTMTPESYEHVRKEMFRAVPGLADSDQFSFECAYTPGWYLCNLNSVLVAASSNGPEFEQDATFRIVPALTGEPYPAVSIESYASPGKHWRAVGPGDWFGNFVMIDSGPSSPQRFKQEAVFVMHPKGEPIIQGPDSVETEREFASARFEVLPANLVPPLSIAWRVEPQERDSPRISVDPGGYGALITRLKPGKSRLEPDKKYRVTVTISDSFIATVSAEKDLRVKKGGTIPQ
jgi:hypothetical protein